MPRKRFRNRRRRRRRNRRAIKSVVIRGPSAFPDRVFVRLRYNNSIAIAFAGINALTFSGNAVNAPDVQAPSQQPRGFREWMAIYDLVKCHKSSIRVDVVNLDSNLSYDAVLLPHLEAPPAFIDTEDAREQPYAKSRRLGPRGGNRGLVTFHNNMKTKVVFGTRFIDDLYAGDINTPPVKQWFWTLYYQNLVDDEGLVNADVSVAVTYWIELYARKVIPRSEAPDLRL